MQLAKLRYKLHKQGLLIIPKGDLFLVTDNGVKYPIDLEFKSLDDIEKWFNVRYSHTNRLTDDEAEEFDSDWKRFVG